jgi:hypothetical protein
VSGLVFGGAVQFFFVDSLESFCREIKIIALQAIKLG